MTQSKIVPTPPVRALTASGLALRSVVYFAKPHGAVCLGIAAATAVIVGALVVGDSVRGSLRSLVLDRLANVQCLLHATTFFESRLIEQLKLSAAPSRSTSPESGARLPDDSDDSANAENSANAAAHIEPLIYLPRCTVEHRHAQQTQRASQVQIFGVDDTFWHLIDNSSAQLPTALAEDEIALGRSLAKELQADIGDELTLHFDSSSGVPAESPLGQRDDTIINLPRQKIVAILPDSGVGGLSFASTQSLPRNVFCSVSSLQDALQCGRQVNAAVVLDQRLPPLEAEPAAAWAQQLNEQLAPQLEDYGLILERVTCSDPDQPPAPSGTPPVTVFDYFQLTSQRLLLDNETVRYVSQEFDSSESRVLAYLANTITKVKPADQSPAQTLDPTVPPPDYSAQRNRRGGPLSGPVEPASRSVPYSIVVGMEDGVEGQSQGFAVQDRLRAFTTLGRYELRYPYCWINSWLAAQLQASSGDWLEIKYFEPETLDGRERERSARFIVAGVVPLTEPAQGYRREQAAVYTATPTVFNDPHLTPTVPGLTDKESIANWDAPFPLELDLIQAADDKYYDNHRLTPKLFMPYTTAAAEGLFRSRFGQTTAIRFPANQFPDEAQLRARIASALLPIRASHGFQFLPVRQTLLSAAAGTTPFDALFLALSFFVIVSALLLVALLFKLGIGQRSAELGLLAAQGFSSGRIRGLLLRELAPVAVMGAGLGIGLGLLYARAMIAALESWWLGAISTPFLHFSFHWTSLLGGAAAGLLTSLVTLYFVLRRLSRHDPLRLLRSTTAEPTHTSTELQRGLLAVAGFMAFAAVGLVVAGWGQSGMGQAGSFFGSGMLLLVSTLLVVHQLLQLRTRSTTAASAQGGLLMLAWRTIGRNPLRSSLTLGLLAVASFLIASMGVFHITPDERGYGGFDLLGETSQAIYRDIGSSAVRTDRLGPPAADLSDILVLSLRMKLGQDASCNNLFQVAQPTILAIPDRLEELADFSPARTSFQWAAQPVNDWRALDPFGIGNRESPIPVILDQNTAAWSLKQGASLGAPIVLQYGDREIHFKTVGLLANSVLQGKLLIGENNFKLLFPDISGYRFFMIRSGEKLAAPQLASVLEEGWSAEGLDITSSAQTLEQLLGVQNTYISAFQSLGALGLLLGTFGLTAVQLRSVLERRRELALMQAVGFSHARIARLLTLETALLLGGGMAIGSLSALLALLPYVLKTGTQLSALQPLSMLAAVLVVGFAVALVAVRTASQKTVLAGLRSK